MDASAAGHRPQPKVSVAMVTYNHERYIGEALESIVTQRANFDFEAVIGEDCSTDRTREVILDYARRYPGIIRPLLRERNLGMMRNATDVLNSCHGTYVATLDGDDYWTDTLKLRKQVDYLDAHAECALCFHPVLMTFEDGTPARRIPEYDLRPQYGIRDFLLASFIPSCSVVFRNRLFGALPKWFGEMPMGDWPLHLLNLRHGKAGVIEEVMAAYRVHAGGQWSGGDRSDMSLYTAQARYHPQLIAVQEAVNAHFNYEYDEVLRPSLAEMSRELVWSFRTKQEWKKMRKYWWKASRYGGFHGRSSRKLQWQTFLLGYLPPLRWALRASRQHPSKDSATP